MSKAKKLVVLSAMVLALGTAVLLNWQMTKNNGLVPSTEALSSQTDVLGEAELVNGNSDYVEFFASARLERENSRVSQNEILTAITTSAEAKEDAKADATAQQAELAKRIEQETNAENLIKAKGFADCVVVISDDSIRVMVQTSGLLPSEAAQISDIVLSQAGTIDKLTIVEVM